ncbi:hypothetical protein JP0015_06730 [Helicobacter pylori]|uniref:DnaJ domain-containing protein n=1 Tax=Helicobacter pylori TaxID=210 RepID=UPI001AAA1E59|nr:DnaJ domain-containing protein [Helicobacter pylori]GHP24324.1 hypothetical protein JP0132_13590 [Helicobacter pylori]GHS51973.1 hypothetical protein JP0128_13370 [Helicobacter pylori]
MWDYCYSYYLIWAIMGIMGIGGAVLGGGMLCTRLEKYYKILKRSPTDSLDAIKKAYRKLASEYHPDKIQSKDLPEAFIIFATEKLKEISHAHEMIVKSRKEEKI